MRGIGIWLLMASAAASCRSSEDDALRISTTGSRDGGDLENSDAAPDTSVDSDDGSDAQAPMDSTQVADADGPDWGVATPDASRGIEDILPAKLDGLYGCEGIAGTLSILEPRSGNTSGRTSYYENCGELSAEAAEMDELVVGVDGVDGLPAPDEAWVFVAPTDGVYPISVEKEFFGSAYIQTDCSSDSICLGSDVSWSDSEFSVDLEEGEGVLVVLDGGFKHQPQLGYTITVGAPCIPQCQGKTCGESGCGTDCGPCAAGQCVESQCIELPTECQVIAEIACGQKLVGLSSYMTGATSAISSYKCSSFPIMDLYKGSELVFSFKSDENQLVTIRREPGGLPLRTIVAEDSGAGCGSADATCVVSGSGKAAFKSTKGASYHFILDSVEEVDPGKNFSISVECCTPACDGKECGYDGCGGTCGSCESGLCSDGKCAQLPKTCEPVAVVSCGSILVNQANSVAGVTDAFSEYSCQWPWLEDFSKSAELTYEFISEFDQMVTVTSGMTGSLRLAVLEDWGLGCVDSVDNCLQAGSTNLTFQAKAGTSYYLVWDSSSDPVVGGFWFEIECCVLKCDKVSCADDGCGGTCGCSDSHKCGADEICHPKGYGEWCGNPTVIESLPATIHDGVAASSDSFEIGDVCGLWNGYGNGGFDKVYQFNPTASGYYTITLDPDGVDALLYLVTDCLSPSTSCRVGSLSWGSKVFLGAYLLASEVYYIVVDSQDSDEPIANFTLTVSAPEALGPGDGCFDPIEIDILPYFVAGDTFEGIDSSMKNICKNGTLAGNGARDQTFRFQAPATGKYVMTIESEFGAAINMAKSCSTEQEDCLLPYGVASPNFGYYKLLDFQEGQEVFINIDSYEGDDGGVYQFALSDVMPTAEGDVCERAIDLGAEVPVSVSGNTAPDDVFADYEMCYTYSNSYESSGGDIVYLLTPPETGFYDISLSGVYIENDQPHQVSIRSSCDKAMTSCVDGHDFSYDSSDFIVHMIQNEAYYIAVSSWSPDAEGAYTLSIKSAQ